MLQSRKGVTSSVVASTAAAAVLAIVVGAVLVSPSILVKPVTETSTTTLRDTTTQTSTQVSTTTRLSATTITTTFYQTSVTTTVTPISNPTVGGITAANITIGAPSSEIRTAAAYNSLVYVSGPSITEINATTNQVAGTIPIAGGTTELAANLQTGYLYANNASCATGCSLFVIKGSALVASVRLGESVNGIAVDYLTGMVYATSPMPAELFVVNGTTNTLVDTLPLSPQNQTGFPTAAWGVAVDSLANVVYVPTCVQSLVCGPTVVDKISGANDSILSRIPIPRGGVPEAVAVNQWKNVAYVTVGSNLFSINGTTDQLSSEVVSPINLDCRGMAVGFDGEVYLSCSPSPNIPSFIILNEQGVVIGSFTQSGSPYGVAVQTGTPVSQVYAVNSEGYVLSVLRTFQLPP